MGAGISTWVLVLGIKPPPQPLTNILKRTIHIFVDYCWLWIHLVASHLGLGFALSTFDVLYWGHTILLFYCIYINFNPLIKVTTAKFLHYSYSSICNSFMFCFQCTCPAEFVLGDF